MLPLSPYYVDRSSFFLRVPLGQLEPDLIPDSIIDYWIIGARPFLQFWQSHCMRAQSPRWPQFQQITRSPVISFISWHQLQLTDTRMLALALSMVLPVILKHGDE